MGEFKQLYVCKGCKSFVLVSPGTSGCPHCGDKLVYVAVNVQKYNAMIAEEKETFHKAVLADNDIESVSVVQAPAIAEEKPSAAENAIQTSSGEGKSQQSFKANDPNASNGWIRGLRLISWIVFASLIISGLVLCVSLGGVVGFLSLLLCVAFGFTSVAMTMVFLEMAEDLKAIRRKLEKNEAV